MSDFLYRPGTYTDNNLVCRDRHGLFNASVFHIWACVMCYLHLFPNNKRGPLPDDSDDLPYSSDVHRVPDSFGLFSEIRNTVCASLNDERCKRLTSCCDAANECCNNQVKPTSLSTVLSNKLSMCPMTWDGYACFPATPAGNVAEVKCPSYISEKTTDGAASKQCMENGTWRRKGPSNLEWTDYTKCVNIEVYYLQYYIGMSCSIGSLVCLVPACIIFLSIKQLRKQHRIHIHLNLFASFALTNCVWLTWDHLIYKDRLENPREVAIMHQHITGCRVLYMLSRYCWTCNFVWMSLEGFHLYRLINNAFQTPKSITCYYFIGWFFPLLPISVYSLVRLLYYDYGCWVQHAGHYEWIMYCPNILCILLNIFFLANVLRVLMTQLQRHSNEPSNYRRALKATVILVPLFGLQLLLVIYRPGDDIAENVTYEIFTKIINNSQGMAVTAVFCFMNGEVHNMLRGRIVCQGHHDSNPDIISGSVSMGDVRRGCYPGGNSTHAETFSLKKIPGRQSSDTSRNGCRKLKLTRKPQKTSRNDWEEQNHLTNTTNI